MEENFELLFDESIPHEWELYELQMGEISDSLRFSLGDLLPDIRTYKCKRCNHTLDTDGDPNSFKRSIPGCNWNIINTVLNG